MRVAHLTTIDLSLRFLVLPQLEAVRGLGGEPIGISAPGPYVADLEARGIRHIALEGATRRFAPLDDARAAAALWRIVRRVRPDVLHTHTPKPGIYGRIVGRLAGVPVVVNTIHGLYATPDDPAPRRAAVYALEAFAARFSDRELVQSREDFELVTRRRITRPDRTVLLGNGVDLTRFDPSRVGADRRQELRLAIGAAPSDVVVGSVGRLVAEKGFPELFAAARSLGPGYVVVVVGPREPEKSDGLPEAVIAEAEEAGVRFVGMQQNMEEWYAAMDVFVLASHREGFPRAAMEAAAMGLPVVASDIRGCREVVDDGVTGRLFPVRDEAALAAAIGEIGGDGAARARMSAAARAKAATSFDERSIVHTVLAAQVTALRERGSFVTPRDLGVVAVRHARGGDAAILARLHADGIDTGFLPTLGVRTLRHLYLSMIEDPGAVVLVADDELGPVGFVAGVSDVGALYRSFLRKRGLRAGLAAAPALVRPRTWRRAIETLRYDEGHHDAAAELLSMAVAAPYRGRGIGGRLGEQFLAELRARGGVDRVKVVVGEANSGALAAYRSMGFAEIGSIEVHRGERSVVLVATLAS